MPDKHPSRSREDLAREDYHDLVAGIVGAPQARSALTLRLVLAVFGLLICGLGAAAFLVLASEPVIAGVLAFFAAVAIVDIVVVTRRELCGEPRLKDRTAIDDLDVACVRFTFQLSRTCVIDGLLEHSPAEHARRLSGPPVSLALGFTCLQFEAQAGSRLATPASTHGSFRPVQPPVRR